MWSRMLEHESTMEYVEDINSGGTLGGVGDFD